MARTKWVCLALLLFLCLGVSIAGRVTEVGNDKPEKTVLGVLGWQPGFVGGIIGALGHLWPLTPTPPPSPSKTAPQTDEGRGSGYERGQVDGIGGGGNGGIDIGRGNGISGGGGGGIDIGGGYLTGGGNGISGGGGGGGGGGGIDIGGGGGGGGGLDIGGGGGGGWGDDGDQSGNDRPGQVSNPSILIPRLTIPGFDVADVIGGEVSLGSSGGLYCTPINCQGINCRGIRLYFENWKDPRKAGSNGQEQNTNHEEEDEHNTNTLDIAPASTAPQEVWYKPIPIIPPSPLPVSVAATSGTVDPLEEELSKVPKPAPASD